MQTNIRQRRESLGLSQEKLGEMVGLSQNTVSRLETGETRLNSDHLEALARFFGCHVIDLLVLPPERATEQALRDAFQALSLHHQVLALEMVRALAGSNGEDPKAPGPSAPASTSGTRA